MYELKKLGKVFTSKFVGTGPSSYKKRIYRAAVCQRLRNTVLEDLLSTSISVASTRLLLFSMSLQVSEPHNKLLLINAL